MPVCTSELGKAQQCGQEVMTPESGVSGEWHAQCEDQEVPDHPPCCSFSTLSLLALVLELESAPLPPVIQTVVLLWALLWASTDIALTFY